MNRRATLTLVVAMLVASACASTASAQAYCALRDPAGQIARVFPGTRYRSVVRTVSAQARQAVARQLPPFTLHFNELGRHTLYVCYNRVDGRPAGLVHVRPERNRRGIMEVLWALDANLTVIDFRFQRCRNRQRRTLESDAFKRQLRGKTLPQLRALLTPDGQKLKAGTGLEVPAAAADLAIAVLRCGMKTIAVTSEVWPDIVRNLKSQSEVTRQVGHTGPTRQVAVPYSPTVKALLDKRLIGKPATLDRKATQAYQLFDQQGRSAGFAIKTAWLGPPQLTLWWSIAADGKLTRVQPTSKWPDAEYPLAFNALVGRKLEDFKNCQTAAELAALEVLCVHAGVIQ